jgi:hypothetical protein
MDPTVLISQPVDVIAIFKKGGPNRDFCTPYKMRYQGRDIELKELGLRHPTSAGKRMIHVFDVSDGSNDYRLEFDAEALTWTLVAVLEGLSNVRP